MEIKYEQDISHKYMVPDLKGEYEEDDYQIHMLMENQISSLLECLVKNRNGMNHYYYDITSRQSMEQCFEQGYMKESDILQLLKSLYSMIHEIERYLLDVNSVLLSPECIYMDLETHNVRFCYLPGYKGELSQEFCALAEYILHHLDQMDQKAVLLGYEIYRQATQKEENIEIILQKAFEFGREKTDKQAGKTLSLTAGNNAKQNREAEENTTNLSLASAEEKESSKTLDERKEKRPFKIQDERKERKKESGIEVGKEQSWEQKHGNKKESIQKQKCSISNAMLVLILSMLLFVLADAFLIYRKILTVTQGGGVAFLIIGLLGYAFSERKKQEQKGKKKESLFEQEEKAEKERLRKEKATQATQLLWEGEEEYQPRMSLISMNSRDRQSVILVKESYVIGKLKSKVDICVNDPMVSRVHAKIVKEGDDYYLCDLNSTNGTFHNGRKLEGNEKVKLEMTDEITFAQSGYYVGKC